MRVQVPPPAPKFEGLLQQSTRTINPVVAGSNPVFSHTVKGSSMEEHVNITLKE